MHATIYHSLRNDKASPLARLNEAAGLNLASVLTSWTATRRTLEEGAHIAPIARVAGALSTLPTRGLMLKLVKVSPSQAFHF